VPVEKAHYERSDISVVPAAGVVGEAMVLLTLARAALEKTGGDSMAEVVESMARWRERLATPLPAPTIGTTAVSRADRVEGPLGAGGDD